MNVDRFVELNKSWLDKFEYNDYKDNKDYPAWWDGNPNDWQAEGNSYFVPETELTFTCVNCGELGSGRYIGDWLPYFQNWKRPTKEEQDYLEMIEGYRLPWSKEHPFIWEEEND